MKQTGNTQLRNSIRQVEKLQNVQTADGLGRAWIRTVFSNELLIPGFSALASVKELEANWYAPYAFLVAVEDVSTFLSALQSLESFSLCKLNADDDNLDCARVFSFGEEEPEQPTKRRKRRKKSKTNAELRSITKSPNNTREIEIEPTGSSPENQFEVAEEEFDVHEDEEEIRVDDRRGSSSLDNDVVYQANSTSTDETPQALQHSTEEFLDFSEPPTIETEDTGTATGLGSVEEYEELANMNLSDTEANSGEITFMGEEEAEEVVDSDEDEIAKALKAIEETSYVEDYQFSSLTAVGSHGSAGSYNSLSMEPSSRDTTEENRNYIGKEDNRDTTAVELPVATGNLQVVPGDRRDFFCLTILADKTPLASPKWGKETVHIVAPLNSDTSGKGESEGVSGSSAGSSFRPRTNSQTSVTKHLRFTRTEDGELALDLTRPEKNIQKGPPGWEPQKRIVFLQIHKKKTPESQFNLCAGCACALRFGIFSKVRYCEYSGKYFCSSCHENETFFVPARILQHWDLSHYSVSKFSYRFIEDIFEEPLFDVSTINPQLYRQSNALKKIKALRQQIFYMKDFLLTCNKHSINFMDLAGARKYLLAEKHVYSLSDFVEIAQGKMQTFLQSIAEKLILHIKQCDLCLAKGFICEFCDNQKPVYPFQLKTVVQCKECKAFFHRTCYKKDSCPKCLRLKTLNKKLNL